MSHMIRQQYVHVELNGTEAEGMALQRRLPDLCHHWLTPAIAETLDRCAPPEGHLTIDRLELEVGTVTLDNLEEELPALVALALENAIREQSLPETVSAAGREADPMQHKTAQQSLHAALIYFLETGSLPWSFRLPEGVPLEQALFHVWEEAATAGEPARAIQAALLPALASATIRQRLTRQFSPRFWETLLSLLSPAAKKVVDGIVPVLHSAAVSSATITDFEQQLWQNVFADVAAGHALSARRLVGEAWHALPTTSVESTALASVLDRHWSGVTSVPSTATNHIERTELRPPTRPGLRVPSSPESATKPGTPRDSPDAGEPRDDLEARDVRAFWEPSEARDAGAIREHPEAKAGIYIENAGLVLLHPFLARFFATLAIATENALLQPERALGLLHFLATGQTTAPEHALVLPKILCNLPLLAPVATNLELTAAETAEAIVLLEAVIRHWSVLRNTSPDGLRSAFLLRAGKVSLRDDGDWLLQVETSGVDLLLDQLPWGLSMIKLPWMNRMVWVEWG